MAQYQRSEYRQQFLPEVDHKLAVWQAYLNVINSHLSMDMISGNIGDKTPEQLNIARASQERFVYALAILDSLLETDKDKDFRVDGSGQPYEYNSVVELMRQIQPDPLIGRFSSWGDYANYFSYLTRVDQLMRRQGFYTTAKLDMGHL